ncbi:cytochrome C oxidase subunit IV [Brevibacterium luteolum]|uniref:cytochrome C oxidase subunit IV n=1 Tax=Brevibacterium luteolum TaxID=199591 RepID=UPI00223B55A3|nr:cytochrome C oxidase subunit IV [Brevibacterium luteolum]MCT1872476.1 cytochrome C oxidase subunit IV [Brevibacterium luteolum]MCT1890216.1 cytochrome C oxidase subunit IV [Brevibacterium luteolum]MCT1892736.1 cytochrome C oxidase subunit IV [Brevibacterium luteolum]MCT1923393.1 cytochrome C oxidase subunit IV [Brevibacterium luteolum]
MTRSPWFQLIASYSAADLPLCRRFEMDAATLIEISGADRLGDLTPANAIEVPQLSEISASTLTAEAIAADDPLATTLAAALRQALQRRQLLWLASIDAGQVARLQEAFGANVLHVAGAGDNGCVPVALNPENWVRTWTDGSPAQQAFVRAAGTGTDALTLTRRSLAALRRTAAPIIERSWPRRFFRSPKVIAYFVVLVYSALRALPVSFVSQFKGQLWVLWTIDLVTAIPYTWGVIAMVAGRQRITRLLGTIVAIITFTAPYVYFWLKGDQYPLYVILIVAGLIVFTCLLEASRWQRDRIVKWRLGGRAPTRKGLSERF